MEQVMIALLGGSAIYLVGRTDKYKKYGYILGLLSQPFWLYSSFTNQQWGIFILSLWYAYSWSNGIWNYWLKEKDNKSAISSNIMKLSESVKDWDGFTTCHGWSASYLLRLIADGKMDLAEEFAGIEYEINEQHGSSDELNDKLDDIIQRAGYIE